MHRYIYGEISREMSGKSSSMIPLMQFCLEIADKFHTYSDRPVWKCLLCIFLESLLEKVRNRFFFKGLQCNRAKDLLELLKKSPKKYVIKSLKRFLKEPMEQFSKLISKAILKGFLTKSLWKSPAEPCIAYLKVPLKSLEDFLRELTDDFFEDFYFWKFFVRIRRLYSSEVLEEFLIGSMYSRCRNSFFLGKAFYGCWIN